MSWFTKEDRSGLWRVEVVNVRGEISYLPANSQPALSYGHAYNLKDFLTANRGAAMYSAVSIRLVRDND